MRQILPWLIGNKDQYALESRVYHAVCVAFIVCAVLYSPISFSILSVTLGMILLITSGIVGVLFYLSRFRNRQRASAVFFQIFLNAALVVNYYYNDGINGPNSILFLAGFLLCVTTAPVRQYLIWLPLNVLLFAGIMVVEYYNPSLIPTTYSNASDRFIDEVLSYIAVAVFAFIAIAYLKKSFIFQRRELVAQSAELTETNQTKNKLLSIIGHDLKEPLASLQGYLELLESFDLDEDEKREINKQLLTMTKNTSLMLTNILAWAGNQENGINAEKRIVNVGAAIAHVVEITEGICNRKQISFVHDIYVDAGIVGDEQMLELIVRNLLMNAVKFTKEGGNILLTVKNQSQYCIITIKDDGIGMSAAMQTEVFSFRHKSRRGTNSEKGSGLGLKLCKEFTEKMGGDLSFVSKEGVGTTFTLALPAAYIPLSENRDGDLRNKSFAVN